jgi:prepilin-type N-terminal cleavage/methylation domain-containing protein
MSERAYTKGFTLIEILVVIAILSILSTLIYTKLNKARDLAYMARAKQELNQLAQAVEQYRNDHNGAFPPDADRNIPPGLEKYVSAKYWPKAPWPGSVYDWENWPPGELDYPIKQQTYQISIRFCAQNNPTSCRFPDQSWAKNFDYNSSLYYCVLGPCRAHSNEPMDHPGYCVNCN